MEEPPQIPSRQPKHETFQPMPPIPETETQASQEAQTAPRLALVAGEGELPLHVARNALKKGFDVYPYFLARNNCGELRKITGKNGYSVQPGLIREGVKLLEKEQITHVIFAGKVDKWHLLRNPRLDDLALEGLKRLVRMSDDSVMLWIIEQFEQHGIKVLNQTDYMETLMVPEKIFTRRQPDLPELRDIRYGFEIAKEMGRLDVGQSIVVHKGMLIAVEAIEGTDECIKRAGKLTAGKGGVLVKVSKPEQDQRFDVPAVGMRTLRNMKKAGLNILATEADQTIYLDQAAMTEFADKHGMSIISTCLKSLEVSAP